MRFDIRQSVALVALVWLGGLVTACTAGAQASDVEKSPSAWTNGGSDASAWTNPPEIVDASASDPNVLDSSVPEADDASAPVVDGGAYYPPPPCPSCGCPYPPYPYYPYPYYPYPPPPYYPPPPHVEDASAPDYGDWQIQDAGAPEPDAG